MRIDEIEKVTNHDVISLFLARLTNLADGASFLIEAPTGSASAGAVSKEDVKSLILEALSEVAEKLN